MLSHGDARSAAASLLDMFREYAEVRTDGETHVVRLRYGQATLKVESDRICVTAEAEDAIRLSYVKMAVAEHWAAQPLSADRSMAWDGAPHIDRKPAFFQTIEVVSSRLVTPHMKRVTFRGEAFETYVAGGLHVRLLFAQKGRDAIWPSVGADGRIIWPGGEDALSARVYTIRRLDLARDEIEIDFVLHEPCGLPAPGAAFGRDAFPGDVVGIFAPGGNEIPDARSVLLLGDETALPAMARIVEQLPEHSRARVFAEIDSAADHYDFPSAANIDLTYLYRDKRGAGTTMQLSAALAQYLSSHEGAAPFIWAGCERDDFLAIRRLAREDLKLPREMHSVTAYWRKR